MATSSLMLEVVKLRNLFQHEDNTFKTSPRVEVTVLASYLDALVTAGDLTESDVHEKFRRTTKAAKESASPFFNEVFSFDVTRLYRACAATTSSAPTADGSSKVLGRPPPGFAAKADDAEPEAPQANAPKADRTVSLRCDVYDTNLSPEGLVGTATVTDVSVVENSKGDVTLTLLGGGGKGGERGEVHVRFSCKIAKPAPAAADPDADVTLLYKPRFHGGYELVPADRPNVWWHLCNDKAWRERVSKSVVAAYPPEKAAKGSKSLGSTASGAGPTEGAGGVPMQNVVQNRWKCRRLHQFFTKFRYAAERHIAGEPMTWTAEQELEQKALWLDSAIVRHQGVSSTSDKIQMAVKRAWLFYLTGEPINNTPGAMFSFEQTSKMSMASFSKSQYECLVGAMIEMIEPNLAGSAIVTTIAKDTFEADRLAVGSRAYKEAEAAAASAPPPADGAAKPKAGDIAYSTFKGLVTYYCDWWAETFTDFEYLAILKTLEPTLQLAKAKADAGGVGVSPRRPASGKARGSSAGKRKKSASR
jgi:hypothetical protein